MCVCVIGGGGGIGFNREMCVTTDKKRTHFNGIAHIILDNINHQNHNNISITLNNPQQRRRNVM